MIKKEDILNLGVRNILYKFIGKYPGMHSRELSRKLEIPKTTLLYHLSYLEKQQLIYSKEESRIKRYYISNHIGSNDKELFGIIRSEMQKNLLLYLFLHPEHTRNDFSKGMDIPPSTISYYLKKLINKNIVGEPSYDNKGYFIINRKEIIRFLRKFRIYTIIESFNEAWGESE